NTVIIYVVDYSKVENLTSIPEIRQNINFFSFTNTTLPLANLTSKFEQIKVLAKEHNADDVIIYVDIKYNNAVIRLLREDKKLNAAFLDAVRPLNPLIFMSRETLNTLNNRKEIRPRILGGEGLGANATTVVPLKDILDDAKLVLVK
ncbi:19232_t:CDS:2, partial [Gigaspora margarita]